MGTSRGNGAKDLAERGHVANDLYVVAVPLVTFGLPTLRPGQSGPPPGGWGSLLLCLWSQCLASNFLAVTCVFLTTSEDSWTDLQ